MLAQGIYIDLNQLYDLAWLILIVSLTLLAIYLIRLIHTVTKTLSKLDESIYKSVTNLADITLLTKNVTADLAKISSSIASHTEDALDDVTKTVKGVANLTQDTIALVQDGISNLRVLLNRHNNKSTRNLLQKLLLGVKFFRTAIKLKRKFTK